MQCMHTHIRNTTHIAFSFCVATESVIFGGRLLAECGDGTRTSRVDNAIEFVLYRFPIQIETQWPKRTHWAHRFVLDEPSHARWIPTEYSVHTDATGSG